MTLSRPRQGRYYKTAVKCKVAVALCTRVRTTVVFSKSISKKRFSSEHVCKVSSLKCRISILSRLLQYFLKVLQNRGEKLKNVFSRAFCARLVGKNSDFRTAHTIFTTKLQTFEVRDSELHFARQKQCFGENYAPDCCKSGPLRQKWFQTAARKRRNKKHRETPCGISGSHPARSRVYYHSEVRTPIAKAMFGEYVK